MDNSLPSRLDMVKNIISAFKEITIHGFETRPEEEIEKALKICISCPFFKEDGPRCGRCGCYLKIKSTMKAWHCPEHRW